MSDEKETKKNIAQYSFHIAGAISAMLLLPTLYCNYQIYKYTEQHGRKPEQHWIDIKDFWIPFACCFVILASRYAVTYISYPIIYKFCKVQEHGPERESRSRKAAKNSFVGIYYTISTIWVYIILKDCDWFPVYLGGSGDLNKGFESNMFTFRQGVYSYTLFSMGYHLQMTFSQLFLEARLRDHEEMMLHHFCTIGLYTTCLLTHNFVAGCTIMFIHSPADIFVAFAKLFSETRSGIISVISMVIGFIAWFYLRCLCLPYVIYVMHINQKYPEEMAFYGEISRFTTTTFLLLLVVLHFFWLNLISQIIWHYVKTGQKHDASSFGYQENNKTEKKAKAQ